MSSRWASENEEPTLDDLVSYANNEAYALNFIDEPIPTSKYTLRTPQKARAGDIPPPPSSVRPPNARRLSSRSILNLQSDMLGGDDGAMSENASTEGDTEMCTSPFDLNVLEQLTLTNLRGSFSSSNQSPLPTSSSSSQAFHMKSILNQVLPDERDDEDDANNQESSTRRPCMSAWSDSVTPHNRTHEDQRMKLRLTRMRAQMQLTISRLQRQNEDLGAALALSKATSAKREKQLAADHAFKLSSKERQISHLKKQLADATATVKSAQTHFDMELSSLSTQVADLKFENKLMQTAYENGRSTWRATNHT